VFLTNVGILFLQSAMVQTCICKKCENLLIPASMDMHRLPEIPFNLKEVDDSHVQDYKGNKVRFKDVRNNYTCVVIFCRNFVEQSTVEYIKEFSKFTANDLNKLRIRIVLIASANHQNLVSFCRETNYRHYIYTDPSLHIYRTAELFPNNSKATIDLSTKRPLEHNCLKRFLLSIKRACLMTTKGQGSMFQQGGQVVIGSRGKVLYFHRDIHSTDQPPIELLLEVAGYDEKLKYNFRKLSEEDKDLRKRNIVLNK